VLYVVVDDAADVLKLGITFSNPKQRLTDHRLAGFDRVVRVLTGLSDGVALGLERALLYALRDVGETSVRGREYFPSRVLPLVLDLMDNHPAVRPATDA
jgi:hypothetical protein